MSSFIPSPAFEDAAAFLSNASSVANTPDATKLELYGIYKLLMFSSEPQRSRPSIFSFTDRAKWDAWKSAGLVWHGKEADAEARYINIAQSLGWSPASSPIEPAPSEIIRKASPTAEELLAEDSEDGSFMSGGGSGMGFGVSTMLAPTSEQTDDQSLHGLTISGDLYKLQVFLDANPDVDINGLDEFGFTALHLACDRGSVRIVELLIRKGADVGIKDEDGFSALDLAREANHEDIILLLESHLKAKQEG
ncbi:ankyrin repeat-containing domain protein [Phellopilus nigrolimitatus]|nr:ankyrin repeat-containing domain protein [Phellopilus nigrolimitatus]